MQPYLTPKLEFSPDPLSDTTPTYTDVSSFVIEASWYSGKTKDLDDHQAGGAVFRLKNTGRQFEPEYSAGRWYPNIVPRRRFRWSITADGVSYPQGTYYAESWIVSYPDRGSSYSEVVVQCVDGDGVLALYPLPQLDPSTAESYADVVMSDDPWGYWRLDESSGSAMAATVGSSGVYKGQVLHTTPNPVIGDAGYAIYSESFQTYGRAKVDDETTWVDSGQVSCEAVVTNTGGSGNPMLVLGPFRTPTTADHIFALSGAQAWVYPTTTIQLNPSGSTLSTGRHHVAMTYDGSTCRFYQDGVLIASASGPGNAPVLPDSGEYIRIGGNGVASSYEFIGARISHAAVYTYALSEDRVSAHATAALSRGYDAQTTGSRIATLATNPLWSTAGIPAGQITVQPRMQTGQTALDEINETTKTETPFGMFYFDDNGNPAYDPFEFTTTIQTVLGEQEVQYDDVNLQYDTELFNQSTVSREGGNPQISSDATSQASYSVRSHDESGLILQSDSDAALIAQAIVDGYKDPKYRIEAVTLNGSQPNRRLQILVREIGDTIRIKRRGEGGTANPDVICRILGKQKALNVHGDLRCTWNVSRGFSATLAQWHLNQSGYAELGQTTTLA